MPSSLRSIRVVQAKPLLPIELNSPLFELEGVEYCRKRRGYLEGKGIRTSEGYKSHA